MSGYGAATTVTACGCLCFAAPGPIWTRPARTRVQTPGSPITLLVGGAQAAPRLYVPRWSTGSMQALR
jgi:hypothetical protein